MKSVLVFVLVLAAVAVFLPRRFRSLALRLFKMLKSSLANLPAERAFQGRAFQPCVLQSTSLECCFELVLVSTLLTSHDVADRTAVGALHPVGLWHPDGVAIPLQ